MPKPDFTLRQGDTAPWVLTLEQNGVAVDLTNADTVTLYLREKGGTTNKIDGADLDITTPESGVVTFVPSSSDTDEDGLFDAYYLVDWSDGTETRFPTDGSGYELFDTIKITPNFE